jgi:hypothetical protein
MWLVGIFAMLAALPVLTSFMRFDMTTLPLIWMAFSVPLGGMLLLALWAGLGPSALSLRIAGLLVGSFYLSLWPQLTLELLLPRQSFPRERPSLSEFVLSMLPTVGIAALLAAMFAAMRRWFQFKQLAAGESIASTTGVRYSVLNLLILMSFVAILLGLIRGVRGLAEPGPGMLQEWAAYALFALTFFANSACAALAALGPGHVRRKCLLVLVIAVLTGTGVALSMGHDNLGAWMLIAGVVPIMIPTALTLASLLWLRPCGLRLVRRARSAPGIGD